MLLKLFRHLRGVYTLRRSMGIKETRYITEPNNLFTHKQLLLSSPSSTQHTYMNSYHTHVLSLRLKNI